MQVRGFSRACRRSSCSPAFLGFQRRDVPEAGAPPAREPGPRGAALPRADGPGAPPPHSSRPARAPPLPAARAAEPARGGGAAAAGACSVPSHARGPCLPPLAAAPVSAARALRPLKVLPNFSSRSRRGAGCCASSRSAARPPGEVRGEPPTPSGRWRSPLPPPSPGARPPRPAPRRRGNPVPRWFSLAPAPRKPPSPFASYGSSPPPSLRQPLESNPPGIGAPRRRRTTALLRGTPGAGGAM